MCRVVVAQFSRRYRGCLCVCSRTRVARSRTRIARIRTHGVRYGLQLRVIRHCGLSEYRALIAQISRSYRRMVDCGVSLSCHGVVAQLWRSYGADMAQLSRSYRKMLVREFRYGYRAVIAQISWDACACAHGLVLHDPGVAGCLFVGSHSTIAQLSRSYRGALVRVVTDTCREDSNTRREDSNTRREVWNRTPSDMKLLLK